MPGGLGWPELLIVLLVAVLLFGGSRLAGVGKASGRAIREFKEETADLTKPKPVAGRTVATETKKVTETVDGTIVETEKKFEA